MDWPSCTVMGRQPPAMPHCPAATLGRSPHKRVGTSNNSWLLFSPPAALAPSPQQLSGPCKQKVSQKAGCYPAHLPRWCPCPRSCLARANKK